MQIRSIGPGPMVRCWPEGGGGSRVQRLSSLVICLDAMQALDRAFLALGADGWLRSNLNPSRSIRARTATVAGEGRKLHARRLELS